MALCELLFSFLFKIGSFSYEGVTDTVVQAIHGQFSNLLTLPFITFSHALRH
ncbi:hypothetical protein BKA81DRAFT_368091, partial [Phyllosticta paracitricarpa]